MLSTTYMRMVLEGARQPPGARLGGLQRAPGRAKVEGREAPRRCDLRRCIPFSETRDYVKKVMVTPSFMPPCLKAVRPP